VEHFDYIGKFSNLVNAKWLELQIWILIHLNLSALGCAERLLIAIRKWFPFHINAIHGLVQIARRKSDDSTELSMLEELLKVTPNDSITKMRQGTVFRQQGRFKEAEQLFFEMAKKRPEATNLLAELAKTATLARNYHLAKDRWSELIQRFPENVYFQSSYIRILLKMVETDRAQAHLNGLTNTTNAPVFQIVQSEIHEASLKWEAALEVIEEACQASPGFLNLYIRKAQLLVKLYRRDEAPSYLNQAQEFLKELQQKYPKDMTVRLLSLKILILAGRFEEAISEIVQLPETCDQKTMELQAWRCHMRGEETEARRIWKNIEKTHYIPQIEPSSAGALQRADTLPLSIGRDEIILFTVVKNEKWRLPWFLNYYRSLGVDRFFFVDNDSSDGTKEYLLEQKDNVHVFWTADNYGRAFSGILWINELMELYGRRGWCMYVDVDEAFVFPGVEQSDLRKLTGYMDRKGHEAFFAFMNDMFAGKNSPPASEPDEEDFISSYPLFDNHYHFSNSIYCPYKFVTGGVRRGFGVCEKLTKTPLIRGGRGIKFLMSSHIITPAVVSDVTGALLHFKLAGNFCGKFQEDLESNTRLPKCQRRHMAYANGLEQLGDNPELTNNSTLRYSSSAQLIELGLIQSSPDFLP